MTTFSGQKLDISSIIRSRSFVAMLILLVPAAFLGLILSIQYEAALAVAAAIGRGQPRRQ